MKKRKWITNFGRVAFVLLFGSLMVGIIYEQSARYQANMKYKPNGAFAEIDGQRVHFFKQGSGGPSVIFASGLGDDHFVWNKVQGEISDNTTTLSYDRPGIGWSEADTGQRSAKEMSETLEKLLELTEIPKPYILVAHSLSGCSLRPFIKDNQADIAGLVFVDTSHPEQLDRATPKLRAHLDKTTPPGWFLQFLDGFGVLRWINKKECQDPKLGVDAPENKAYRANHFRSISGISSEMDAAPAILNEVKSINDFGNIPFILITAQSERRLEEFQENDLSEVFEKWWMELQADQLNLSSQSRQVFAKKSGHMIPIDEPEIVVSSIRSLLQP